MRESIIDIGGTPKIHPQAIVKGSRIVIDDAIHLTGDDGRHGCPVEELRGHAER